MRFLLPAVLLLALCGCRIQKEDMAATTTVNSDVITPEDVDHLEKTIETSNNTTQNALTGLFNASVSKLGDKLTGVEARMEKMLELNNTLNAKLESQVNASADLRARLDAQLNLNTEVKARLDAQISTALDLRTRLDTQVNAAAELKAKIDANAELVTGIGNKIDRSVQNLQASAGRDVNMFPKVAADMIILQAETSSKTTIAIVTTLCGLISTAITIFARNSRRRADQRWQEEREERRRLHEMVMKLAGHELTGGPVK